MNTWRGELLARSLSRLPDCWGGNFELPLLLDTGLRPQSLLISVVMHQVFKFLPAKGLTIFWGAMRSFDQRTLTNICPQAFLQWAFWKETRIALCREALRPWMRTRSAKPVGGAHVARTYSGGGWCLLWLVHARAEDLCGQQCNSQQSQYVLVRSFLLWLATLFASRVRLLHRSAKGTKCSGV